VCDSKQFAALKRLQHGWKNPCSALAGYLGLWPLLFAWRAGAERAKDPLDKSLPFGFGGIGNRMQRNEGLNPGSGYGVKKILIAKSPLAPFTSFIYTIKGEGLVLQGRKTSQLSPKVSHKDFILSFNFFLMEFLETLEGKCLYWENLKLIPVDRTESDDRMWKMWCGM
ncbi:hypothetical protein STEG23_013122, partial [Scotinomys teguina]